LKSLFSILVGLLPSGRGKNFVLRALGHHVASSASIGPILLVGSHLTAEPGSRIGPFNVVRSVRLDVGAAAEIGQWNWISAAPFLVAESDSPYAGTVRLGAHSSLTSRHYLDASGGIAVGAFATVAGVRTTFMTHGIDVADNVLDTEPIIVGDYAMVGGNTKLVMGARVPDRSIVAMGSVVTRGLQQPGALYAGAPALFKKEVPGGEYAARKVGAVPPRRSRRAVRGE
jgi:acetyltransferase-like isoleucine patch superfamily enzyme